MEKAKVIKSKKKTCQGIIINSSMVINEINSNKDDTVLNRNTNEKVKIEIIISNYTDRIKKTSE